MKPFRLIAAALILLLFSNSVLAAACAGSCAASAVPVPASQAAHDPADHCHEDGASEKTQAALDHCSMAGCHVSNATFAPAASALLLMDFSHASLPLYHSRAVSADLAPPIKPPA